jgi:hypothetical protein
MTGRTLTIAAALALTASAALAQQGSPACQRLEAQLAALDRGNDDPARAEQIRRAEQAVNQQQFEVDRLVAASRRQGCESSGFFSIFNNPPAQCSGLSRQIDQARNTLERTQNDLEKLNGGNTERAAARRSLLISLGDQGCGPQYRAAAAQGQRGGFFDQLFGNNNIFSNMTQAGGTFRTICVRTCDGYYYPISFATTPQQFAADEQTCRRTCPASEVNLYTYRNPGEEVNQAASLDGRLYTQLPAAFAYRTKYNAECSCRKPGQSWADAMKTINDTIEQGDIVVNEQRARQLSAPRVGPDGKPIRQQNAPLTTNSIPTNTAAANEPAADNKTVRSVGPQFYPVR